MCNYTAKHCDFESVLMLAGGLQMWYFGSLENRRASIPATNIFKSKKGKNAFSSCRQVEMYRDATA